MRIMKLIRIVSYLEIPSEAVVFDAVMQKTSAMQWMVKLCNRATGGSLS